MVGCSRAPYMEGTTGVLALDSGEVFYGFGLGAEGEAVGELCFNTGMTGYQEVMTDPSYAGQIVTFTFPHIGNVGVNDEDQESNDLGPLGCVLREPVRAPSNFRSCGGFDDWLAQRNRICLWGVDTRALTRRIREGGAPRAVIAHHPDGIFDVDALLQRARDWPGLKDVDMARVVSAAKPYDWQEGTWGLGAGYAKLPPTSENPHIVVVDYGVKQAILRQLAAMGARISVVPATMDAQAILDLSPDGVFLSNGPADPAATAVYAAPVIRALLDRHMPLFGICLGYQLLGLAAGARTVKMHQGHRGANHPVRRLVNGCVEITSMNHGFAVDTDSLPDNVVATHFSLFDGSLTGLEFTDRPAFGVQYHPEASPGPQDSHYLFAKFMKMVRESLSSQNKN